MAQARQRRAGQRVEGAPTVSATMPVQTIRLAPGEQTHSIAMRAPTLLGVLVFDQLDHRRLGRRAGAAQPAQQAVALLCCKLSQTSDPGLKLVRLHGNPPITFRDATWDSAQRRFPIANTN
jgi:hypothetical protein